MATNETNITIIGVRGSGKTVFMSVLAHRFGVRPDEDTPKENLPCWFEYSDQDTGAYKSTNWSLLKDQKWPPSSFPTKTLSWELKSTSGDAYKLNVVDAAGQTAEELFSSAEAVDDPTIKQDLEERLRPALENSDIIIFAVSVDDALNAKTQRDINRYQILPTLLCKEVLTQKKRVLLLLTKHDKILPYLAENGIPSDNPNAVLRHCLPDTYNIIADQRKLVKMQFVSAVHETENSEVNRDGKLIAIPKKGFSSTGIDETLQTLLNMIKGSERGKKAERIGQFATKTIAGLATAALLFIGVNFISVLLWEMLFDKITPPVKRRIVDKPSPPELLSEREVKDEWQLVKSKGGMVYWDKWHELERGYEVCVVESRMGADSVKFHNGSTKTIKAFQLVFRETDSSGNFYVDTEYNIPPGGFRNFASKNFYPSHSARYYYVHGNELVTVWDNEKNAENKKINDQRKRDYEYRIKNEYEPEVKKAENEFLSASLYRTIAISNDSKTYALWTAIGFALLSFFVAFNYTGIRFRKRKTEPEPEQPTSSEK